MSNSSSFDRSTCSELLQSEVEMCVSLGCLWLLYRVVFSAGLRSFLFGLGELILSCLGPSCVCLVPGWLFFGELSLGVGMNVLDCTLNVVCALDFKAVGVSFGFPCILLRLFPCLDGSGGSFILSSLETGILVHAREREIIRVRSNTNLTSALDSVTGATDT